MALVSHTCNYMQGARWQRADLRIKDIRLAHDPEVKIGIYLDIFSFFTFRKKKSMRKLCLSPQGDSKRNHRQSPHLSEWEENCGSEFTEL